MARRSTQTKTPESLPKRQARGEHATPEPGVTPEGLPAAAQVHTVAPIHGRSLSAGEVLGLQRAVGNRSAQQLVQRASAGAARGAMMLQRSVATGTIRVQRDAESDRVQKLDDDYEKALAQSDWTTAAERLNAFNREDILTRLGKISRGQRASLYAGARDNPNVGPDAQVAELTRPAYLDMNYENEMKKGNWGEAAKYLNGFNDPDIAQRVEKLASGDRQALKQGAGAGSYERIVKAIDAASTATPASQAPNPPAPPASAAAPANPYQPIIDQATQGPASVDNEKAWLLDRTTWNGLLTLIPDKQRNLGGIPIGGMKGWLHVKGKPVVVAKFGSKADGPNNTGLITYQGNYLLWRHAIHHNHNPTGGPENTGTYDAMEGYKLPIDIVAKSEARKKANEAKEPKDR